MTNKARRNKKSLLRNTMNMAVNMVKASSLSIAKMSLGTTAPQAPNPLPPTYAKMSTIVESASSILVTPRSSQRSQQPETDLKHSTYLLEPCEGARSTFMIKEGMDVDVDGRASDYIRRIHQKNISDSNNISRIPPPPLVK